MSSQKCLQGKNGAVMSAHTPGPWIYLRDLQATIDSPKGTVCRAWMHDGIGAIESSANARLIAAAPDMLAALIGLIGGQDSSLDNAREAIARAAIAKATGGGKS